MTSYAQSVGATPFNWRAFLDAESHTSEEWARASTLAKDWPTCACGGLDVEIARAPVGHPLDRDLYELGCHFAEDIHQQRLHRARDHFAQIEARAAILISQARTP